MRRAAAILFEHDGHSVVGRISIDRLNLYRYLADCVCCPVGSEPFANS